LSNPPSKVNPTIRVWLVDGDDDGSVLFRYVSTDGVNWPPAPGATKDQATGIGCVIGVILDDFTGQYGLVYLHLQNVPQRFITHLPTGVLGIEDPVFSETVL
jgi:hypothetical protein